MMTGNKFRSFYKACITNLVFVIHAWSPYLVKDIKVMENQRQATKIVPALRDLDISIPIKDVPNMLQYVPNMSPIYLIEI